MTRAGSETKAKTIIFTGLFIILAVSIFGTTYAITGNSKPDQTPYVGVVVLFADQARTQPISYSTGVLISPTVVLTAGHSVFGGAAASVCFDSGPITWSIDQNGKLTFTANSPVYNGLPVPFPDYAQSVETGAKPSQYLQTSDIGLIILDTPVKEVTTFPTLPFALFDDSLPARTLLQIIGYGVQSKITPTQSGSMPLGGSVSRNSATVQLLSSNFKGSDKYLKITANAAQGKGGAAYGDSGGPVMDGNTILAINSIVDNPNCAGVTYATRVDNPQVLSWLGGYLEQSSAP